MKKKIIIAITAIFATFTANSQDNFDPLKDRQLVFDVINICAVLVVVYLISGFILQIMKQYLEYRLKSNMIEKQTAEAIVNQLLQSGKKDTRHTILQWFFIMAAIGIGFAIINFSRPYGLHSLAIMAISIAAGFGGYYIFTRNTGKS